MFAFNQTYRVNLITVDTVVVANTTTGLRVISINLANPQNHGQAFQIIPLNGHPYVVPSYINVKKYDLLLFDISYLIKEGYYNSTYLPVIIKAPSTLSLSALAQTLSKFNTSTKQISSSLILATVKIKNDVESLKNIFSNVLEKRVRE